MPAPHAAGPATILWNGSPRRGGGAPPRACGTAAAGDSKPPCALAPAAANGSCGGGSGPAAPGGLRTAADGTGRGDQSGRHAAVRQLAESLGMQLPPLEIQHNLSLDGLDASPSSRASTHSRLDDPPSPLAAAAPFVPKGAAAATGAGTAGAGTAGATVGGEADVASGSGSGSGGETSSALSSMDGTTGTRGSECGEGMAVAAVILTGAGNALPVGGDKAAAAEEAAVQLAAAAEEAGGGKEPLSTAVDEAGEGGAASAETAAAWTPPLARRPPLPPRAARGVTADKGEDPAAALSPVSSSGSGAIWIEGDEDAAAWDILIEAAEADYSEQVAALQEERDSLVDRLLATTEALHAAEAKQRQGEAAAAQVQSLLLQLQDLLRRAEAERDKAQKQLQQQARAARRSARAGARGVRNAAAAAWTASDTAASDGGGGGGGMLSPPSDGGVLSDAPAPAATGVRTPPAAVKEKDADAAGSRGGPDSSAAAKAFKRSGLVAAAIAALEAEAAATGSASDTARESDGDRARRARRGSESDLSSARSGAPHAPHGGVTKGPKGSHGIRMMVAANGAELPGPILSTSTRTSPPRFLSSDRRRLRRKAAAAAAATAAAGAAPAVAAAEEVSGEGEEQLPVAVDMSGAVKEVAAAAAEVAPASPTVPVDAATAAIQAVSRPAAPLSLPTGTPLDSEDADLATSSDAECATAATAAATAGPAAAPRRPPPRLSGGTAYSTGAYGPNPRRSRGGANGRSPLATAVAAGLWLVAAATAGWVARGSDRFGERGVSDASSEAVTQLCGRVRELEAELKQLRSQRRL